MPPSTDVFGKHKKKIKLHKRQRDAKQDAQVGHVGKGRKLLPNEEVEDTPNQCPGDGCSSQE